MSASDLLDTPAIEKKLQGASNSQDIIQSLSTWALDHKAQHELIVAIWFQVLKTAKFELRLSLFYLCNEIVQTCRKRHAVVFKDAFKEVLKDAALLVRDQSVRQSIGRIFNIWSERKIYDEAFVGELLATLNNTKVKSSLSSKLLKDFHPETLKKSLSQMTKFENRVERKRVELPEVVWSREEIDAHKQELKNRKQGEEFVQEFERTRTEYARYVQYLEKEKEQRMALILMLEQSDLFYDAQMGECNIVTTAYKNYSAKVSQVRKRLWDVVRPEDRESEQKAKKRKKKFKSSEEIEDSINNNNNSIDSNNSNNVSTTSPNKSEERLPHNGTNSGSTGSAVDFVPPLPPPPEPPNYALLETQVDHLRLVEEIPYQGARAGGGYLGCYQAPTPSPPKDRWSGQPDNGHFNTQQTYLQAPGSQQFQSIHQQQPDQQMLLNFHQQQQQHQPIPQQQQQQCQREPQQRPQSPQLTKQPAATEDVSYDSNCYEIGGEEGGTPVYDEDAVGGGSGDATPVLDEDPTEGCYATPMEPSYSNVKFSSSGSNLSHSLPTGFFSSYPPSLTCLPPTPDLRKPPPPVFFLSAPPPPPPPPGSLLRLMVNNKAGEPSAMSAPIHELAGGSMQGLQMPMGPSGVMVAGPGIFQMSRMPVASPSSIAPPDFQQQRQQQHPLQLGHQPASNFGRVFSPPLRQNIVTLSAPSGPIPFQYQENILSPPPPLPHHQLSRHPQNFSIGQKAGDPTDGSSSNACSQMTALGLARSGEVRYQSSEDKEGFVTAPAYFSGGDEAASGDNGLRGAHPRTPVMNQNNTKNLTHVRVDGATQEVGGHGCAPRRLYENRNS